MGDVGSVGDGFGDLVVGVGGYEVFFEVYDGGVFVFEDGFV